MKRLLAPLALALMLCVPLHGCVTVSGRPDELPKEEARRYDDAGIKTGITSALLKDDASQANTVNVHSFNGHVFLVGEATPAFRAKALDTARRANGVVHVTSHWFPDDTASTSEDAAIEAAIEAKRLFPGKSGLLRVAVDVWGGHVVLTGLGSRQSEVDSAVSAIRAIPNVKSVTSYITVG